MDHAFAEGGLEGDGSPLLLAVSGGPDSTVLMRAAACWSARRDGPPLLVATVDHGLRATSRGEAEAVGRAAASLGLPHEILPWDRSSDPPGRRASQASHASQARAREARYRLLADHARAHGAKRLATAHTLDDQAETVLIRLARGSGPAGLAGMSRVSARLDLLHLRPFLGLRKAALVATCRTRGWDFVQDPTNADSRHARPRWRALSAALAAEGLTPERLARLAARMGRAEAALEAMAGRAGLEARWAGPEGGLDFSRLLSWPDEIALRVLVRALRPEGERGHLRLGRIEDAFCALRAAAASGSALRLTLAGRLLVLGRDGRLMASPEPERRRGRRDPMLTEIAAGRPHSLGIGSRDA